MEKMSNSRVLIVGLGGLGVEIAKNVILAGVKAVDLYDNVNATYNDLSSQFYLEEKDIGHNRALSCASKLSELNPYVPVSVLEEFNEEALSKYRVLIMTEPLMDKVHLNELCRKNNVCFLMAQTNGLFGMAFCDFGDEFIVTDVNGEAPQTGMISSISEGVVFCIDEGKHGLEDGDFVRFREVKGLNGLNQSPPMKIKVLSPNSFSIGPEAAAFGNEGTGGIFEQVKQPKILSFVN